MRGESEYEAPLHGKPVLGQEAAQPEAGFSSRPPSRGLADYPRENPLFDEEDEEAVPEASDRTHSVTCTSACTA